MADRYGGAWFLINVSTILSLMTEGKADFTSRKSAATTFFSLHFWRTQEVRNKFASSVLRLARPPKWPSARIWLFSAQKLSLLVMMLSKILLRQESSAICRYELGEEYVSLLDLQMMMVVACFQNDGKCPRLRQALNSLIKRSSRTSRLHLMTSLGISSWPWAFFLGALLIICLSSVGEIAGN
jgi:hypothetical protein